MQEPLSFLIDSNVIIAVEPFAGRLERANTAAATLLRLATANGHHVYVHPASLDDFAEDKDSTRRAQNQAAYRKYAALADTPVAPEVAVIYPAILKGNDQRDARILSALHANAVEFLVTSDERLIRRAVKLGLDQRVLRPDEAAGQLAAWHPDAPPPPPLVELVPPYQLDAKQAIFNSLRADYGTYFDTWLDKVKKDSAGRRCWVVRDSSGVYQGLAIVKIKDGHPGGKGYAIKLSTFKITEEAGGQRLGELLLKTVLHWAAGEPNRPSDIFVEVKTDDTKERLVDFLEAFGFTKFGMKADDEATYIKQLDPAAGAGLTGLEHHIRHGPPALLADQPIYVVPIEPKWYDELFPDAPILGARGAVTLDIVTDRPGAHGNSIRKAYLGKSKAAEIPAGAMLLFYRSQGNVKGDGAVLAVGVTETSLRTSDPVETIRFSFKRTVYSPEDVVGLHANGAAVLSIRFRHDRFLGKPWPLDELKRRKVLAGPPQSITRVRNAEGVAWVESQLNVWR